jgi:hypothetical protein
MEHLTSQMERLQWRRDKIQDLSSKGHSQREIASIVQVGLGSVNRDLTYIRQQAKANIKRYIDERLPEEYEKCLVGLNSIVKEAWITSEQTQDRREKIQALSLAKECYAMKLDLLTNATVVDDAIRFVTATNNNSTHCTEVKPKVDAYVIEDRNKRGCDIQRPEEESRYRSADSTTNSVF